MINLVYNLARYEQIVRLDLMKPEPVGTGERGRGIQESGQINQNEAENDERIENRIQKFNQKNKK